MQNSGTSIIACEYRGSREESFSVHHHENGRAFDEVFGEASLVDVDAALAAADAVSGIFRRFSTIERVELLLVIAEELEKQRETLVACARAETGLGALRLTNELTRTLNQIQTFASIISNDSWKAIRIDHGEQSDASTPKPDLRTSLVPIGPVAVFCASNFPFALSVAGTDTISAFAAGCPVVVRSHFAHAGTSEKIASAIVRAIRRQGAPKGIFSMLQGTRHEIGRAIVSHPKTCAVAFTGSRHAGRMLLDVANDRRCPVPFFGELGSINPVFVLPGTMERDAERLAAEYVAAITVSAGQMCTKPGVVFGVDGESMHRFMSSVHDHLSGIPPAKLLYPRLVTSFREGVGRWKATDGVELVGCAGETDEALGNVCAQVWSALDVNWRENAQIRDELFGPASMIVRCTDLDSLLCNARMLEGELTASVHAQRSEFESIGPLLEVLQGKVGRIVLNGFGVGVEVRHAMHHGGPYPATTAPQFTSIGQAAIYRFVRPVCYQGFPDELLPRSLRRSDPGQVSRLIDGQLEVVSTRE